MLLNRNFWPAFSHSIPLIPSRTLALSASNTAISARISCDSRNGASSSLLGFLTDRSKVFLSISSTFTVQDFSPSVKNRLQSHELFQVIIVQRVCLSYVPARIELVIPDLLGWGADLWPEIAKQWFIKAAKQGHKEAKDELKKMESERKEEIRERKAERMAKAKEKKEGKK